MTGSVEVLDRLIAFDTVSARSNLGLIDYARDYLDARGFAVTVSPDGTGQKAGIFATLGPPGQGVLLSAHSDVVPTEGQAWTRDPFKLTVDGDRLYGRGTTDMKGFLAAMLACADRAAHRPLSAPLSLAISYDEEVGCLGIGQMMPDLAPAIGQPRLCIVGEPTNMHVAIGHKGKQALRATCFGEAGHSSLAPQFINALHPAADFVTALRRLQREVEAHGARDAAYDIPYTTFHVGRLTGGTALNIVPDRAEIVFEFRHLAADAPADLRARIDALAAGIAGCIEIEELFAYPGLATDAAAEVTRTVQRLAQSAGTTKVAFGTEAGFFDQAGIPVVVCGPGDMAGQGHKPDEYLDRGQLAACDAMLDRVLDEIS